MKVEVVVVIDENKVPVARFSVSVDKKDFRNDRVVVVKTKS